MALAHSIIKWTLRAWPFLAFSLLLFIHQFTATLPCYISYVCWSNSEIDKFLSFALNVTGGLLVLYSIDSNLGLFKKGGLFSLTKNWVKAFPLIKKDPIVMELEGGKFQMTGHPIRLELSKTPESVEELYKYTQEQISLLRKDIKEERKKFEADLNKVSKDCSSKYGLINKSVNEINAQLKAVAIGGIKLQIFGVLLVIYGSYIGLST